MENLPTVKTKAKDLFYQAPALNTPKRAMYKEFNISHSKIEWLKDNKDMLESKYEVNVINLINAYMNDNWPQKRERQNAN